MSAPARRLAQPGQAVGPERARPRSDRPSREPARAARPRTTSRPQPGRRARRTPHPVFLIFSGIIVTALVAAAVSLSAMLVQASFRADALEGRLVELADRSELLDIQVAELSSPSRVSGWARARGMATPDDVVFLTIPGQLGLPGHDRSG